MAPAGIRGLTVLLVCFFKYRLVFQQLLDLGEQCIFFVVMVRLDKLEPGETVANEIGLVLVGNERGLVVDGVVTAEDRVVWCYMSVRFREAPRCLGVSVPRGLQSIRAIGETYAAGPCVLLLT